MHNQWTKGNNLRAFVDAQAKEHHPAIDNIKPKEMLPHLKKPKEMLQHFKKDKQEQGSKVILRETQWMWEGCFIFV